MTDFINKKQGKLTVLYEFTKLANGKKMYVLHCKCDCGKEKDILKWSNTVSCGCAKFKNTDKVKNKLKEHWRSMIKRCNAAEGERHFKWYGINGIKVCERWQLFYLFYEDMIETWDDGLELDRIENNKGYYKDNCRWVTKKEQQRNRTNVKLTIEDIDKIKKFSGIEQKEIAKLFNVSPSHISRIINNKVDGRYKTKQ